MDPVLRGQLLPRGPAEHDAAGAGAVKNGAGEGLVPDANPATMQVWDAVIISYVRALKIRRLTFEAGALFAGRMPMTSCYVGGGVTNDGTENLTARCTSSRRIIREVGLFIVNEYVPIALAPGHLYRTSTATPDDRGGAITGSTMKPGNRGFGAGSAASSHGARSPIWTPATRSPFRVATRASTAAERNFTVAEQGRGRLEVPAGRRSATGAYAGKKVSVAATCARTSRTLATTRPPATRTRNVGVSGCHRPHQAEPRQGDAYTYMKAPRWAGKPCEVGPFARLAVAGIYPVNGTHAVRRHPAMPRLLGDLLSMVRLPRRRTSSLRRSPAL